MLKVRASGDLHMSEKPEWKAGDIAWKKSQKKKLYAFEEPRKDWILL